jgi:hypothetical protein
MYALCGCALLWSVQSLLILSLTLSPPIPPFFNLFQYTFLYRLPSHLVVCDFTVALSFSFPFFLSPNSIELQTCYTTEFVYDHACFCVYVYLWICRPRMKENMYLLCF